MRKLLDFVIIKYMNENPKDNLEKISQELIQLGKDLGAKLAEKTRLEEENRQKEEQVRRLQDEIFVNQTRLAKIIGELKKLENQRSNKVGDKPKAE